MDGRALTDAWLTVHTSLINFEYEFVVFFHLDLICVNLPRHSSVTACVKTISSPLLARNIAWDATQDVKILWNHLSAIASTSHGLAVNLLLHISSFVSIEIVQCFAMLCKNNLCHITLFYTISACMPFPKLCGQDRTVLFLTENLVTATFLWVMFFSQQFATLKVF